MTQALLNKHEVAKLLTVSRATIDRLRKQDDFPKAFNIGGSLRWNSRDIVVWLEGNKCQ